MNNKTYNGWSNYATWRVNLEVFDGMTLDDLNTVEVEPYELGKYLKDYAEECIFLEHNPNSPKYCNLIEDYARAFLSDVNWYEIAEHMIKDQIEEKQE